MINEDWDFWNQSGLSCCGYDSAIDADLIKIFIETSKKEFWYSEIANRLSLNDRYVCLLIEILCSNGFCEYGTSPRGAWAVKSTYQDNLDKLKFWYKEKWGDELEL